MRAAYADPPYPGNGHRYEHGKEVNHRILINWLDNEFESWALSTGSRSLQDVLALCPPGVRVCPWVKPYWGLRYNVRIQWAWEPVIVKSSRTGLSTAAIKSGRARWVKDWLETLPTGRYFTKGGGQAPAQRILGEKPAAFCRWVFELLGLEPGDELVDVFPGSGAVMEAFEGVRVDRFTEQLELDYR